MKITILTIFPEMFNDFLNTSIIKKARLKIWWILRLLISEVFPICLLKEWMIILMAEVRGWF